MGSILLQLSKFYLVILSANMNGSSTVLSFLFMWWLYSWHLLLGFGVVVLYQSSFRSRILPSFHRFIFSLSAHLPRMRLTAMVDSYSALLLRVILTPDWAASDLGVLKVTVFLSGVTSVLKSAVDSVSLRTDLLILEGEADQSVPVKPLS